MKEMLLYGKMLIGKSIFVWLKQSAIANYLKLAIVYVWALFIGIHSYIYCILTLILIDVVFGIKASLKQGKPYRTRILRKGLLEKFVLYFFVILVAFIVETVVKQGIEYDRYYIVFIAASMISFYEAGSIIEKLIILYPQFPFLKRLGGLLNVLDTEVEKKTTAIIMDGEAKEDEKEK